MGDESLANRAESVAKEEKDLAPREAIKGYSPAILWSLVISTCVIMEGYDTNLIGNFYAYRMYASGHL
jgi:MFS transporter, SP family, general alpha glucoside:H+ symporter